MDDSLQTAPEPTPKAPLSDEGSEVLRTALHLALGPAAPARRYVTTRRRTLTRRGLVWLGQTCNLRCYFCYFLDRIRDPSHPEHRFMPLSKAKAICDTLVATYGNNAIDIQGGEPTLHPDIVALVRHCREIGLHPTIITNAQRLAEPELVRALADAGIRDFLVSVQGLGETYDRIVGKPGAHRAQMTALRNLREAGVPFRFNCVMSRPAVAQLADIARLAVRTGAHVVNFLAFNPYDDQGKGRSAEGVPRYDELRGPLAEALDVLGANGVEANVRYLPLCVVEPRHRASAWNFQQLSYDHHENDFASWRWTQRGTQRTHDGELSPAKPLAERWGPRGARLAARLQRVLGPRARFRRRDDERTLALYREDGRRRAADDLGYTHPPTCASCDLRTICDGFHRDYVAFFGAAEARPVDVGGPVDDPTRFVCAQHKIVQPEDTSWACAPGDRPRPR
jgi:MoaA/NifB/PqqE/SkfB family radical SAM enzyme